MRGFVFRDSGAEKGKQMSTGGIKRVRLLPWCRWFDPLVKHRSMQAASVLAFIPVLGTGVPAFQMACPSAQRLEGDEERSFLKVTLEVMGGLRRWAREMENFHAFPQSQSTNPNLLGRVAGPFDEVWKTQRSAGFNTTTMERLFPMKEIFFQSF